MATYDLGTADLAVAIIAVSPATVLVGENLSYTVEVTNNGPHTATAVMLTDPLPSTLSFVSYTASQGSCATASGVAPPSVGGLPQGTKGPDVTPTKVPKALAELIMQSGDIVTCDLGNLASGVSATVDLLATTNASGTTVNTVFVSASEVDPDSSNDTASVETTVLAPIVPPPAADDSPPEELPPPTVEEIVVLLETDPEAAADVLAALAAADASAATAALLALAALDPELAELLALAIGLAGQRVEVPIRTAPLAAQLAQAEGEQVLNVGGAGLYNIKPWREGGRNRPWMHWVYMPPFLFDESNGLVQGFATAYTLSDDGLTYIFHLNPYAVFQDGSPLTAAAYKKALEFGVRPADQVGWGGSTLDLKLIEGADAAIAGETSTISGLIPLGDHDLAIRLISPTPTFPKRMATWLQGAFKAEAADADPDFFLHPIGAGPYQVTSYIESEILELTATGNWWGPRPIITKVDIHHITDNQTELTMFESGALDIIYGYRTIQPEVHDPSHPLNPFLMDIPYPGLRAFVRFDTAKEPFQDINVRKALAHAIDHDAVVEAVYGSKDLRANGVLQPEMPCWDPGFQGYTFDPELARQYLAQSTYKTGANVPLLQIASRSGSDDWNITLEAWQSSWKQYLDVDFKVHLLDRGQPFPPGINMHRDSLGALIPDPGFLLDWMVHTKSPFGVMHVNDALDARLDAANALRLDDPGRCAAFQGVEREFMGNYYILPITKLDYKFLVQP